MSNKRETKDKIDCVLYFFALWKMAEVLGCLLGNLVVLIPQTIKWYLSLDT
jgi:hypothetical protein